MSLDTAIIIATALLMTLPIGWWVSRASRPSPPPTPVRVLTKQERSALVTELRVVLMRGDGRGSEAERVMRSSAMKELRREGLGPAELDGLTDAAMHSLWMCHRLAFGSDAEAAKIVATLPAEARANWSKIRAKVKRERETEARREAEDAWIRTHPDEYDRLTTAASGGPAITNWLGTQGPTVWHAIAPRLLPERIGWGPWLWLAEQDDLDRATAIAMFLKAQPVRVLSWRDADVTGPRRDQLMLLRRLARRLADEDFEQRSFSTSAESRSAYFEAQQSTLRAVGELPWAKLSRHALGPMDGLEARTQFVVEGGSRVRRRIDLAPYVSGQRRP